jgi:hypothetical protein
MTQQDILIISAIVGAFCFLMCHIYWFARLLIIRKHLPRLKEDNRSSGKGVKLDWTIWGLFYGDKKIEKIDKELGKRLLKMSIKTFCLSVFTIVCFFIFFICKIIGVN